MNLLSFFGWRQLLITDCLTIIFMLIWFSRPQNKLKEITMSLFKRCKLILLGLLFATSAGAQVYDLSLTMGGQTYSGDFTFTPSTITTQWGSHVPPSVVTGRRRMELPGARYSGGDGLLRAVEPCGESQARHWEAA